MDNSGLFKHFKTLTTEEAAAVKAERNASMAAVHNDVLVGSRPTISFFRSSPTSRGLVLKRLRRRPRPPSPTSSRTTRTASRS